MMVFPIYGVASGMKECEFRAELSRADGKEFGEADLSLQDQFLNKTSVHFNKRGEAYFSLKVNLDDRCWGISLQGPNGRKDLLPLLKHVWGEHCV